MAEDAAVSKVEVKPDEKEGEAASGNDAPPPMMGSTDEATKPTAGSNGGGNGGSNGGASSSSNAKGVDKPSSVKAETTAPQTSNSFDGPPDASAVSLVPDAIKEAAAAVADASSAIEKATDKKIGNETKKVKQQENGSTKEEVKDENNGGKPATSTSTKIRAEEPGGTKAVQTDDKDRSCIDALLSLGRNKNGAEDAAEATAAPNNPNSAPGTGPNGKAPAVFNTAYLQQQSTKPSEDAPKAGKRKSPGDSKKQKLDGDGTDPPDFWYWLQPDEKIGDWDVLCGRGGESNNFIGNKKYRSIVNERKDEYRAIPLKQRKAKTAFVRSIVQHVNNCGGRFVDICDKGYFVATMERARKKTSQALRETKELKWLQLEPKERKTTSNKSSQCPYCKKMGHKTKIAKACLLHHEWVAENSSKTDETKAIEAYVIHGGSEEEQHQQAESGTVKEEESGTVSKHSGGAVQNVPEQPKVTKEVNHDKESAMRHEGTAAEKQEIGAQLSAEAISMNTTEV
jgi:hypothetical protein